LPDSSTSSFSLLPLQILSCSRNLLLTESSSLPWNIISQKSSLSLSLSATSLTCSFVNALSDWFWKFSLSDPSLTFPTISSSSRLIFLFLPDSSTSSFSLLPLQILSCSRNLLLTESSSLPWNIISQKWHVAINESLSSDWFWIFSLSEPSLNFPTISSSSSSRLIFLFLPEICLFDHFVNNCLLSCKNSTFSSSSYSSSSKLIFLFLPAVWFLGTFSAFWFLGTFSAFWFLGNSTFSSLSSSSSLLFWFFSLSLSLPNFTSLISSLVKQLWDWFWKFSSISWISFRFLIVLLFLFLKLEFLTFHFSNLPLLSLFCIPLDPASILTVNGDSGLFIIIITFFSLVGR